MDELWSQFWMFHCQYCVTMSSGWRDIMCVIMKPILLSIYFHTNKLTSRWLYHCPAWPCSAVIVWVSMNVILLPLPCYIQFKWRYIKCISFSLNWWSTSHPFPLQRPWSLQCISEHTPDLLQSSYCLILSHSVSVYVTGPNRSQAVVIALCVPDRLKAAASSIHSIYS